MLNVLSTAGASILGVGYLLPMIYLIWSLVTGERAPANPWGATGSSGRPPRRRRPRTSHETPIVTHGTHEYAPSKEVGIV